MTKNWRLPVAATTMDTKHFAITPYPPVVTAKNLRLTNTLRLPSEYTLKFLLQYNDHIKHS
jgi:hypothetical protein